MKVELKPNMTKTLNTIITIITITLFLAFAISALAQTPDNTATAAKPKPLSNEQQNTVLRARLAAAEARRNYAEAVAQVQGALEKMREQVKQTEEAEQTVIAKAKADSGAPVNCSLNDKIEWNCPVPAAPAAPSTPKKEAKQ